MKRRKKEEEEKKVSKKRKEKEPVEERQERLIAPKEEVEKEAKSLPTQDPETDNDEAPPILDLDAGEADKLRVRAKTLTKATDKLNYKLAETLYKIFGSRAFKRWQWETFQEYVETELAFSLRKARYLMKIYWVCENKLTPEQRERALALGWCLHPDQAVSTYPVPKPIKDVKAGDCVVDADGGTTRVEEVGETLCGKVLFEITVAKAGKILASPQHSFPVLRGGEEKRVQAWDLNPGDLMFIPKPQISGDCSPFAAWDEGAFEFAGWYTAEGYSIPEGQIRITLGKNGKEQRDKLVKVAGKMFPGHSIKTSEERDGKSFRLSVSGGFQGSKRKIQIHKEFQTWFGSGCENKNFPDAFFSLSNDKKVAFLRGLWKGDGSQSKKAVQLVSTSSFGLANKVRMLAMTLDVLPTITKVKTDKPNRLDFWTVSLSCHDGRRLFGDDVPLKSRGFTHYQVKDDKFLVPIRQHRLLEYEEDKVFHLGTASGMFCCGVVSYNTKLKEIAGLIDSENADDWIERAEELPASQLIEEVRAATGRVKSDEKVVKKLSFPLSQQQLVTVEKALQVSADISGSKAPSHQLEMICLSFLSENDSSIKSEKWAQHCIERVEQAAGIKGKSDDVLALIETIMKSMTTDDIRKAISSKAQGALTAKELLIFLKRSKKEVEESEVPVKSPEEEEESD